MSRVPVVVLIVRVALAVLFLCLARGGTLHTQVRAPIVESVDLAVSVAPVAFPIAGRMHYAYELHVTNFLLVDVSVTRIQVTTGDPAGAVIADYRDHDIGTMIGRPGRRRDEPNPQIVGPGMRAVVYFWIALPPDAATPRSLAHRVELDVLRPAGAVHTVVEGGATRVADESADVLDPPLRGGPWVAIYAPALRGGHRTAIYTVDGRARIPGRFAIDWIRLRAGGTMDPARSPRPADWNGYGEDVLAVADGIVSAAMDDIPENDTAPAWGAAPVTPENASGNYVALDIGRGRVAFYEHLKRGTIVVKAGDRVRSGQVIARLGYSGSSSIGPHLHFHVSDANAPLAAEGLPFVFKQFDHLGAFTSIDALIKGEKWVPAGGRGAAVRRGERPEANSVVGFR